MTIDSLNLCFENIIFSYTGSEKPALNNVSIILHPGERVALVGRNGSGKSTLMLIANGILRPHSGRLLFSEQAIQYNRKNLLHLRQNVGIVFQNPEDQLFSASVLQDLSLGPLNMGMSTNEARERVMEVAEICGLTELLDRPTHALSGGEKARAALAGVLAMKPLYLFADEVTNSLDPWMRNQIMEILDQWVKQGHTVVLSTHDWRLAEKWAQRIIWMEQGQIYRQGNSEQIMNESEITLGEWKYG
jgi:cobalt/nickel transport system ATP-binding protein